MPTVDEHLIFDGKRYAASTRAASKAGFTNDYLARLCRQGKVRGKMIGKTWYVEEDSLFSFLVEANKRKAKRKHELRAERREEYRVEGEKPLLVAPLLSRLEKPKTKPKAQSDPWTEAALHTARSLQYHSPKRALAFALSLAIVFSVPVFAEAANKRKAKRKHELRAERREEYRVEGEKPLLVAPLLSRLEKPNTKPKAQSDPWTEAALHTARSLQYHSPKRALAFALSLAIVFSMPVFAEAIPQGVRELRQSFVGRAALATAKVLDDSLVGAVLSAEVSAFREAKEGIAFTGIQLARRLKSDAPAAVLETTSNSDTISFTIRLEELKVVFYKSLSLVKAEIVRLLESLFPQS